MKPSKLTLAVGALVHAASFVFVACSGGGDSSTGTTGGSSGTTSSGGTSTSERKPGESCILEQDADSTRSSSRVCEPNPALGNCKMCLDIEDRPTCIYACRIGGTDCPNGQTCSGPSGNDRQGECDGLGSCK